MTRGPDSMVDEFIDRSGITYRMLDYWTTQGHLHAEHANPGTGVPRLWSPIELDVARTIARLRAADLPLPVAARVARAHVVDGEDLIEIADGVSVLIEPDTRA